MASRVNELRREIMESPHPEESYQDALYFESDLKAPLKSLRVNFLLIQDGAGDPSPENVRPIHGWDGIEISHYGKNLLPTSPEDWVNAAWGLTETYTVSTSRLCIDKTISIKPNTTYTINVPGFFIGVNIYNGSGNRIYDSGWKEDVLTFTTASTASTIGVNVRYSNQGRIYPSIVGVEMLPQLELGSVATAYAPRTNLLIDWTDDVGTIYGGYVDLVKGEVVEEWANIANYASETLPGEWISDRDIYNTGATPTTGAQVVYMLTTPIHHPIDPITLKTLRGINNIWSDSNGAITAKYWSHTKNKNQIDKIHLLDTFILNGGALA